MEEELWKPCTLNNTYQVSSLGRWKWADGRIYAHKPHRSGYVRVQVKEIGIKALHILVALAFIPNAEPLIKHQVNHINGIRSDNRVSNLEWVSVSENANKKVFKRIKCKDNPNRYTDLSGEVWRSITLDTVSIKASNYGRIETQYGTKTYGSMGSDGYMRVHIKSVKIFLVHRLVCAAFHGPAPVVDYVVNHKDYNRTNNTPENLEWVTQSYNNTHGALNRSTIVSHNQRRIEQWTTDKSKLVATYDNIIIAAEATGSNRSSIVQMVRQHPKPRYSVGGFFWKYADDPPT
jgi:hypothetical protein